jgi:hypothetical protein
MGCALRHAASPQGRVENTATPANTSDLASPEADGLKMGTAQLLF